MKRKAAQEQISAAKRREPESDYCDVSPKIDDQGIPIWPASVQAMQDARQFLSQWYKTIK